MKILIVEDEALTARRIKRLTEKVLIEKNSSVQIFTTLDEADTFLKSASIDLLLLDLNLNGLDGFELLKKAIAGSFHTIIISANVDKALEAFEYGVLDFIPKPFNEERLRKAFKRFHEHNRQDNPAAKYLSIIKKGRLSIINVEDILYIKGAGVYSEVYLKNSSMELHNKSLALLQSVLPSDIIRVHKSFLVNREEIVHIKCHGASKYDLLLKNGTTLPVGRVYYKTIKDNLS